MGNYRVEAAQVFIYEFSEKCFSAVRILKKLFNGLEIARISAFLVQYRGYQGRFVKIGIEVLPKVILITQCLVPFLIFDHGIHLRDEPVQI